eukprot:5249960-Amphidinium_carterae.5
MDINQRIEDDSCCRNISQGDVRRCGQKWSLMYDSGAAVSVAPLSFAPHVPLQTITGGQKLQSVTDADIKIHGFKKCTIMSGGIGLRVNFIICDVSCPIGNSTKEEHPCYAIVKQPPHNSYGWLHQQSADQQKSGQCSISQRVGICGSDFLSHEEDSDMQHVAKSFSLFGPENQPGHSAEGTHHSTSEAAHCTCTSGTFSCRENYTTSLTFHSGAGVRYVSEQKQEVSITKETSSQRASSSLTTRS